jgi:hypothetical protein
MKKKVLMSLVLLAIIGTSAVFAQQPTLDKIHFVDDRNGGYEAWAVNKNISGAVVIPDTYNGKPVTVVRNFGSNPNITSVIFPNSLTRIETNTFLDCTSITSVTIPASVTTIQSGGLKGWLKTMNLTSVTFQGSNTTLAGFNSSSSLSFDGDLDVKYKAGGAGTYTREAGGKIWTKQGGYTLNGTYTRSDGTQITITDNGQNVTITGNYPNNGGRINETLKR